MQLTKHLIEDDIWQYEFKEDETSYVITILIHEKKALLIDTAYERHTAEVLCALKAEGITPAVQVISHYHPDHCGGLHLMTACDIIASSQYMNNWNRCQAWLPDLVIPHPRQSVTHVERIHFGKRQLTFMEMTGHTTGHIVTQIDQDYIHVGDLLMRTASGLLSLPYLCEDGNVLQHQENLATLHAMNPKGLLLAHGEPLLSEDTIKDNLSELLFYLKALTEGRDSEHVEAYLSKTVSHYGCLGFHENNVKQSFI